MIIKTALIIEKITDRMADTMPLLSAVDTASIIKTNTKFYN